MGEIELPKTTEGLREMLKADMNRKSRLAFHAARRKGKSILQALDAAKSALPR